MKKVKLNKNELKKMLRFLDTKPDNTIVELNVSETLGGERVIMKIDKEPQEYDVTDYLRLKNIF